MQHDPRAYLWDVREAALAIQNFVAGLDATAYAATPLVHSAVERKFEIIGEALSQLAKLDKALAARVPGLPQIVAFRNQLIHAYAKVNDGTVWNVVQVFTAAVASLCAGVAAGIGRGLRPADKPGGVIDSGVK